MEAKRKRKDSEIVIRGGTPTAVILGIGYRELLEWVEDAEDLKTLRAPHLCRTRSLRLQAW
jgi:hypothetical protein